MASHKITIFKTISWRILGTFITAVLLYLITGKLLLSLGFSFIEICIKSFVYYFHERFWEKIINKNPFFISKMLDRGIKKIREKLAVALAVVKEKVKTLY